MEKIRRRIKKRRKKSLVFNYDKSTAIRAAIAVSLILAFIMLSSSLFFTSLGKDGSVSFFDVFSFRSVLSLLSNALLLYFLFRLQFWAIFRYPDKRTKIRAIVLSSFVLIAVASPVFTRLQWWWFQGEVSDRASSTLHYVKDMVILIISFMFTALIYLFNQNREKVIENQNLEIENLQNRYNALKNQVDPHFLFNSLNTLNGLIGFDNARAHEYVGQLSHVFRYTMQEHQVIELDDELKFAESYIYLMKIRYNDALSVHMKIEPHFRKFLIVPFGLQILVENAIKHNVITRKSPLCIIIETTPGGTILVENNIQLKYNTSESNGLGLTNLNDRYRLMFDKEIDIKPNRTKFIVEIPLIEKNEDSKIKSR